MPRLDPFWLLIIAPCLVLTGIVGYFVGVFLAFGMNTCRCRHCHSTIPQNTALCPTCRNSLVDDDKQMGAKPYDRAY